MTPKLKVWRTAFETYAVIFQNLGFLVRYGWAWILLAIVLLSGLDWVFTRFGYARDGSALTFADFLKSVCDSLITAACLTMFAVAWHRRILHSVAEAAATPQMSVVLRYALVALVLEVTSTAAFAMSFLRSGEEPTSLRIVVITGVLLLSSYLWCRALLLLPAIAIGADMTVTTAWRNTRRNGWRLAASVLLAIAPPITGLVLFDEFRSKPAAPTGFEPSIPDLMANVSSGVFGGICAVIGIAFLSIAYRELVLKRAEATPRPT